MHRFSLMHEMQSIYFLFFIYSKHGRIYAKNADYDIYEMIM